MKLNINIRGKGSETLTKNDFVSSGGQGSIYAKKGVAYKIYNDPTYVIPDKKIQELSVLSNSNIIRPIDVIVDDNNKSIGYTMNYIKGTYALCQLFNKAFKDRNALKTQTVMDIIGKMRDTIHNIHQNNILIVDLNEMNFLIDKAFSIAYFIDVDSYQTQSYKAQVIMESIRDRHCKNMFSEVTDWFSFGIVSFQMFVGIHPYKGKHPKYNDINDRMMRNISVFNKDVSVPKIIPQFDIIPKRYLDWYKLMFDKGDRLPPPFDGIVIPVIATIKKQFQSTKFKITNVYDGKGKDVGACEIYGGKVFTYDSIKNSAIIIDRKSLTKFVASIRPDGMLEILNHDTREIISDSYKADEIFQIDGNFYVKNEGYVAIIEIIQNKTRFIVSIKQIAFLLENATKIYDNVVIQDLLGSCYVSIFNGTAHHQINIKELNKKRITDAKHMNKILMIVYEEKGEYKKVVIKFDELYRQYKIMNTYDESDRTLNFITLNKGICAHINNGRMELFSNNMDDARMNVIDDNSIEDFILITDGNDVYGIQDDKVFLIKM
jgi:serine/threonine protein kinase